MKFPVFSLLAGNFGFRRRVRSRLPPPAESRCKPGFLSVLPRTKGQASEAGNLEPFPARRGVAKLIGLNAFVQQEIVR